MAHPRVVAPVVLTAAPAAAALLTTALQAAGVPTGRLVQATAAAAFRDLASWSSLPFDRGVTALAAAALTTCVAWIGLVTAAAVVEELTGRSTAALRAISPPMVRRLAAACCGLVLGGAAPLHAAGAESLELPATSQGSASTTHLLTGLPLPDRVTGVQRVEAMRTGLGNRPEPAPARHRVARGESLWTIAERLLGGGAPEQVDATWREVYDLNRAEIGEDPDLLLPGTVLDLPDMTRLASGTSTFRAPSPSDSSPRDGAPSYPSKRKDPS